MTTLNINHNIIAIVVVVSTFLSATWRLSSWLFQECCVLSKINHNIAITILQPRA